MARDTESTTKFKVDISDFKKSMQEATRLTRLAESEFKAATAGMGKWSDSVDGVNAKLKQLDKVLAAQKTKLTVLEREYEEVVKEQGESSKAAQELMIKINNQTAAVRKTEADMKHYGERLDELSKDTLELGDATVESGNDAKKGAEGFTVMKGALASLVADGIKLAIKGLKNLSKEALEAYKEFDKGADSVIKATGATGEAAESLIKSYEKVAGSIKGDFSSIGETLGEINTRMGLTNAELEKATVDFTKFAEVTGTDAKEAVRLVTRAMENAGIDIKDYNSVLDELTTASQASGIGVDTLAESLTKYGAPMRQLGFDTKETISLLSAMEKGGVNTSVAMTGLRKAVGTWGKEGKDARQEFTKVIKEIKKAPNITKATEKAIEAFGTKAGPELAEAIKQGRFEYEDFVKLLDNSKDSVSKTYEATQDGFDRVQVSIQKGRIKLANIIDSLLRKYEPQISRFIKSATKNVEGLIDTIESGIKFILNNKDGVLSTLKAIATAFITYKAVTAISAVVAGFQSMITAIKGGQTAMVALNGVMTASPWGLLAAGITAVVVGLGSYALATKEAALAQWDLTHAQQESIDKSNEIYDEYKQIDEARKSNNSAIESEFKYLKELKKEYNGLVGENGKIKEGYEARAEFILNQLAEAMGVEREEIDKTIKKNGELGKSLDDLMIKQQAQAIIESNKQFYSDAITTKQEKLEAYQEAITTATAREKEFSRALSEAGTTAEAFKKAIDAKDNGDLVAYYGYSKDIGSESLAAIERAYEAYNTATDALTKVENAYVDANQTIENYEGLSAAVLEGDAEKIADATQKLQNNLISAEAGNERLLTAQSIKAQIAYQNMQKALEDGMAGVTRKDVKNAKELVSKANEELIKYLKSSDVMKELKSRGYKIADNLSEGLTDGSIRVGSAMDNLTDLLNLDKGYGGAGFARIAKELGLAIPESIVDGILTGKMSLEEADKALGDVIIKALENTAAEAGVKAENIPEAIKTAVLEGEMTLGQAAEQLKGAFDDSLTDDGTTKQKGTDLVGDFADGITSSKETAKNAGKTIFDTAVGELSGDSSTSGKNFAYGFLDGINTVLGTGQVKDTAGAVAKDAISALKKAQKEGSPSKITTQSGKFFTQGFVNGIKSLIGDVKKAAGEVAKTAISQLKNGEAVSYKFDMSRTIELANLKLSSASEKKLKEYDKTITRLEKERDQTLTKLENKRSKETDERTQKELDKQINSVKSKYKKLINAERTAKENFSKASATALSDFSKTMTEYAQKAEELIDSTIQGVTDKYTERYDALIDKQTELTDKLKGFGSLFEVSGAGVMTVNDIKEQTRQIEEYAANLNLIKSKVSSELFDQIASYDLEEGSAFLKQLIAMDEDSLKAYNQAYTEKMNASKSLAEKTYAKDINSVNNAYKKELKAALGTLPAELEELGRDVMKSFVKGLTEDTQYMGKAVKAMVRQVTESFKGESSGLFDMFKDVKSAIESSIKDLSVKVELEGVKVPTQSTASTTTPTTITNNYNLVQNNTSPKSLSALETYTARRQQLAMLKAL